MSLMFSFQNAYMSLKRKAVYEVQNQNYERAKSGVKPRENGRNIVGQQLPTLLDFTCCVRLHTLLHVVGCCWLLLRKV